MTRAEINDIKMKKTIEKANENKNWSYKKMNKTDKPLDSKGEKEEGSNQEKSKQGLSWWYSAWKVTCQCKGTLVWSLVQEDSTCHGATQPMHHDYWAQEQQMLKPAHTPGPTSHNYRVPGLQPLKPMYPGPELCESHSMEAHALQQRAVPAHRNWRVCSNEEIAQPKINY